MDFSKYLSDQIRYFDLSDSRSTENKRYIIGGPRVAIESTVANETFLPRLIFFLEIALGVLLIVKLLLVSFSSAVAGKQR